MATELTSTVLDRLETLFEQGTLVGQTDRRLLDLFATADGPASEHAFAALVQRHAGMVHRVCQGLLNDSHEAEDATQATFLVLARRARTIRGTESLSSWLYGTARRIALRARRDAIRRDRHEREKAVRTGRPRASALEEESSRTLYRELDRLPEIQRTPIVLCYLENLTHEQAAARVGCPVRTFQSRLLRGRQKLQTRLAKQGVGINSALLAIGRGATPLQPPRLDSLAKAAHEFARRLPASHLSQAASHMAQIELTAATSWRIATLATTLGLLIAGTTALAFTAWRGPPAEPPSPPLPPPVLVAALPTDDEPDRTNRTLDLRVQERESGKPLAGVAIEVHGDTGARDGFGGDARLIMEGTTDQNGHCRLEFPHELPRRYSIKASHPGYAIRGYAPMMEPTNLTVVKSHIMEMEPGITIGGIVKNEDGQPLSNATVSIMSRAGVDSSPDYSYVKTDVMTDEQGQWRFGGMPSGWEYVYLRVSHPDHVPTVMQRNIPKPSDLLLKAKKAETVLSAGIAVTGLVLDDQGKPIDGAEVGLGSDRQIMQREYPKVLTDANGRFTFGHVPEGTQTVTAQAPGRSPEFTDVLCSKEMKPIEFRLGTGHTIRGRVVNQEGKPLDDVTVQTMNWKGHSSLDWRTTTNSDGRFTWDSAPAEPVLLTLTRPGYVMLGQRKFQAGEQETQVMMLPPQRIHGTVVDAKTGKPISRFGVITGIYYRSEYEDDRKLNESNLHWERGGVSRVFSNGEYEVEHSHPLVKAVRVKIEAEGYLPAISPPAFMDQLHVIFDARLEPGQGPSGIAIGLDGKPLAGARVILSTKSLRAQLYNGKFHESAYPQTQTDSEGRFHFPPQAEPYRVFVDHERGFAEADQEQLEKSPELKIEPWGRVEGIVKRGSKVAAGAQIRLSERNTSWNPDAAMPITQAQEVRTDERGRFVFERVIPAKLSVSHLFTLERSSHHVGTAGSRNIIVQSDKTAFVDLGGTGRSVIGRFVLPQGIKNNAVFPYYHQPLELIRPEPPYPPELNQGRREEWLKSWIETDEGRTYDESNRVYDTNVRPDGRFRVDDVGPGKYRIQAEVREPSDGIPGTYGPELARCDIEVVVPEIPGGRSDEPLDLGTIELKPVDPKAPVDFTATLLKPGMQAPGFEVKTVDEKTVRLEDLRGKFVLLDFWATWCGPCVAEIPHLKAAYDTFGKDERLAIVSLSLDKNLDDPRGFAEAHQLKWVQGFLGDWADAKLPEDYGVQAIPAIFLIGPDGKIVQSGLRGDAIEAAIAEALKAK